MPAIKDAGRLLRCGPFWLGLSTLAALVAVLAQVWPAAAPGQEAQKPAGAAPTHAADPFPMPADWAHIRLLQQTDAEASAKSAGCVTCHLNTGDPHAKATLRL